MKRSVFAMGMFAVALCLVIPQIGVTCNNWCNTVRILETCVAAPGVPAGTLMVYKDATCIRCVGSNRCRFTWGEIGTCKALGNTKRAQPGWVGGPLCNCAAGLRNVHTAVGGGYDLNNLNYVQQVTLYTCNGPFGANPDYDDEALTPVAITEQP